MKKISMNLNVINRMRHMKNTIFLCCWCSMIFSYISCNNEEIKLSGDNSKMTEVDLGLSVKWANMNLGASSPDDFGEFYALGEVQPHDTVPSMLNVPDDWQEWHDSLGVILPKYDAACFHTNNKWRIPTKDEWTELCLKCKWKWVTYNGVEGFYIKGPSGKSIFLPAAGDTRSKYGDIPNGLYRCSFVFDVGASDNIAFNRPSKENSPNINIINELEHEGESDVFWSTWGCHVPASIRPVRVD